MRLKRMQRGSRRRRCLLEIFAGSGRVADAWRRRGGSALAIDVRHRAHEDVLDYRVRQGILRAIARQRADAVWLGTPCSSWSLARRGRAGRPGGPLRTLEHLGGVPAARAHESDRARILGGDRTLAFSADCIASCVRHRVPVAIENPASSRLWHASRLSSLLLHPSADSVVTDMCQHGATYRKRTRVVSWHASWPHGWAPTCVSSGRCTRTGAPHEMLRGSTEGATRTSSAAVYPMKFTAEAAAVLWNSCG